MDKDVFDFKCELCSQGLGVCQCSIWRPTAYSAATYPNWVEVGNEGEEWNINWDRELKELGESDEYKKHE